MPTSVTFMFFLKVCKWHREDIECFECTHPFLAMSKECCRFGMLVCVKFEFVLIAAGLIFDPSFFSLRLYVL